MIPTPAGWQRIEVGEDVILLAGTSMIRYRERLAPVLPVELLLAGQLADDPQFTVSRVEPRVDFATIEGERASTIAVHGTLEGRAIQRHIGYVLAEDFYARVSSLSDDSDGDRLRTLVRAIVERVSLRLGARRRRVAHEGPFGWRAHNIGLRMDWIAPEFPRDPSCITIWPAVPGPLPSGAPPVSGLSPVHSKRGLSGVTWRIEGQLADGSPRTRDLVLLADGRYRYALRLDTDPARREQRRAEFLDVIDSLDPVPSERRSRDPVSVSEHWVD